MQESVSDESTLKYSVCYVWDTQESVSDETTFEIQCLLHLGHSGNFFLKPSHQGSPQPPSTVPAKPGLPTAPQHSTSKARAPHSPSTVPVKPGLPTAPQQSEACLPQPVTSLTACLPHSLDLYSLDLYLLDIYTFIWKHSS